MRATHNHHRVLISIEKYPAVQSRADRFFAERDMFRQLRDSDHLQRGIRGITRIAKYPLSAERSIDDVDIEHYYNFCFRA